MELQYHLRTQGLEEFCEQYAIKVNRHHQYPHLVCLKYSQIDSPLGEKVVQQCRGIILDENQDWEIISYSYDKFFNYGEGHAATIDWSTATVYDKLDGSLMVLYFYQGKWQVQSSGTPDAIGLVNGFPFTFRELFWRVWEELGYRLPEVEDYCFSFELMTPYNRIVVRQEQNDLVLHGVRNIETLQEESPLLWGKKQGWKVVPSYPLGSWDQIIKAASILDPMTSEGYIVCDGAFRRVKVKSPQYVAIAHLREGFSTRRMLEIILNHEGDEFLSYYPEWRDLYQQIEAKYNLFVAEVEKVYDQYKDIPVQKDFAIAIKDLPYSGILFALRRGKTQSIRESLRNTTLTKVEQLLGVDNIDLGI